MELAINWTDSSSHIFMNPCYSQQDQERFQQLFTQSSEWPSHCWLSTSGSSVSKWVGLSKQAILASASTVNQHLMSTAQDRWIQALPSFHVGGLGIWARAYLSGAAVEDYKFEIGQWDPKIFYHYLCQKKGTLTALVPTQLYDLIRLKFSAPSSLRAVIIGGGGLNEELYQQGVALGWPILPSYGLTECASQVATASLKDSSLLKILPHWQVREQEGRLAFKGDALLSTYGMIENNTVHFVDPKQNGWFVSEDRGIIQGDHLIIQGRADNLIKIYGENVNVDRLNSDFQTLCHTNNFHIDALLVAVPNERIGHYLCLVTTQLNVELSRIVRHFQERVLPFERIRQIVPCETIPRSPLGKVLKKELQQLVVNKIALKSGP